GGARVLRRGVGRAEAPGGARKSGAPVFSATFPAPRPEAGATDEAPRHDGRTVGDLERQSRQPSRRRPIHDTRAVPEIELREMARALDPARRRQPLPSVTTGMRTHRRIGDYAVRGSRARIAVES